MKANGTQEYIQNALVEIRFKYNTEVGEKQIWIIMINAIAEERFEAIFKVNE